MHSIEVMELEPPSFSPTQERVFAELMVVSIDIPVFQVPWGGGWLQHHHHHWC
jgi:hypothetical protein